METHSRRDYLKKMLKGSCGVLASCKAAGAAASPGPQRTRSASERTDRPNILFAIADDLSWPHCSAYGCRAVSTPAFDRVAREGVLFTNAFCAAPQCSPNRAAILTGRYIWQLEEAGTHASSFPAKFRVFTDQLEAAGYQVGFTGKGWGPGDWKVSGRERNPAGPEFNNRKLTPPRPEVSALDYAGNFGDFLKQREKGRPFCFWYGATEPHRTYEAGSGLKAGKKLESVAVPPFLPDVPEVRADLLDYFLEVEWFDRHLGEMLAALEESGELENTLVVVTSDNGMPFPRAKANLYEYGIRVPLAVRWGDKVRGRRVAEDLVSFVDFAPTFLDAARVTARAGMAGRSFLDILTSGASRDSSRGFVLAGRERHSHCRPDNLGYPVRAIRSREYLYIWNMKPERWPIGDPPGYHDTDDSPTKTFLLERLNSPSFGHLAHLSFAKRPGEELYDIRKDPGCLENLAEVAAYARLKEKLSGELKKRLTEQEDPRLLGYGDIFESYPRYSAMRDLPGFKKQGEYNPRYQVRR